MSALHGSARRRHGNGPSTAVAVPAPPPGGARRGLSGAGGRWLGDDHPAPPGGRCRRRPRPRLERAGCVAGRPGLRRRGSVSTQTRRHGGRVSGWTSAGSSTCCGAPRWRGPRGRRSRGNTRTVTAGGGYGSDASALADGIRARRRAGTLCRTPRDPGPCVAAAGCGCYTRFVKSAASTLRARDAAEVRHMTPEERLALAFRLGDEDLESFRVANGLDRPTAIRLLERRRQATRLPSACLERLIG